MATNDDVILEMRHIVKRFGPVTALNDVNITVKRGQIFSICGENGAGKSTLIKIMSGLHDYTSGEMVVDGEVRHFSSPRQSLSSGIATVYQDLALAPLQSVWRNFFLGSELSSGGALGALKISEMKEIADTELKKMGITVKDINQPIGCHHRVFIMFNNNQSIP